MDFVTFVSIFKDYDVAALKLLTYQALLLLFRGGGGTAADAELLSQLERDLGVAHLAVAA